MFRYFFVFLSMFLLVSCGGSKQLSAKASKAQNISQYAKSFLNTPYKYGGTTRRGIDCSGLVYQSFLEYGEKLPRTTKHLADYGKKISLNKTQTGDLVFFKTSKKWGKANHVGIVVSVNRGVIKFIHSSTSRGVIISDLNQDYWAKAFRFARRVL